MAYHHPCSIVLLLLLPPPSPPPPLLLVDHLFRLLLANSISKDSVTVGGAASSLMTVEGK